MLDLGIVRPGSTIRIPFSTFDKDDGSSITMTNFAVADILVYKDGSTTERASTSGYTATTDFDSKTGKHLAIIDLSDNTTAGFWAAGSEYLVAIDSITVDTVTTGGWIARFTIGYADAILNTTIATLSTQTSFTLTDGPAEDDALNNCQIVIHDVASKVQVGRAVISDYTGSTKTVTLAAATTFTAAASDNVAVLGLAPVIPTVAGRTLDITATGAAGVDWGNVENQSTTVGLSGTTIKTATDVETDTADIQSRLPAALVGGKMDSDATAISGSTTAANNAEIVFDTDFASNYNATADKWNTSVTHFGGTAGTFSGGRPEVNTTHWGGTAVASATVNANVASVGSNTACIVNIVDVFDTSFGSTWNGTDGMWVVDLRKIQGVAVAYSSGTFDFDILETAYGAVNTNLDAAITSRMATYTQPTGFLAATFPTTVASTTNITAGTITTVTNLTNAPTSGDLTATMKASVNAEVDAALADIRLDELLAADSDIDGAAPPTVGSVFHELMTKTTGSFTYDQTTDSLEALRDRGDAAWITATGFSTHSAADVWAVGTRVLTAATNISGPIADQVWDEALSGHLSAGSTGEALNAAGSAGDPWTTTLPGSYTGSQAGKILADILVDTGTTLDGLIQTVDTVVDAIKVKTDYLPSATAGAAGGLFIAGSNAATTVDITGNITGNLSGSVGSISGITFPTNFGSTVISAGGVVSADTVAVSGDTTAANNLESYLDGTDFMPVDAHKPVFSISGATLTVKKPDGTTTAYTRTLTTDATADPVTGSS